MTAPIVCGLDRVGTTHQLTPEQRDSILLISHDRKPKPVYMGNKIGTQFRVDYTYFRVFRDELRVEITLPRILRKSNVIPVSYSELPQVIAKISDWLEIDYLLGRVHYLEVNVTAGCSTPPNVIFNGLGTLAFFHGETKDDGGRVYKNSRNSKLMTRDLSFYNKYQKILAEGQEALSMAGEDLSYFMGLIPARVEYTLQGKALHKPNALYVRDLANSERWNVLLTAFAQQLEAIRVEQGSQRATDDFHPCTPLVLQRTLASCGLRQYGRVQLERMFDQWQANGDITVHQKKALKESVEMLDLLGFGAPTEGQESTDFIRRCVEHLMAPVP